jgi:hypothetical protein
MSLNRHAVGSATAGHLQKNYRLLSAPDISGRILNAMERPTTVAPNPVIAEEPSRDVAAALGAMSSAELLRLNALARLWTRGMPGTMSWADVLQEAIARALDGSRKWPPRVPILAFLSGVCAVSAMITGGSMCARRG